jgi:plastocyanin
MGRDPSRASVVALALLVPVVALVTVVVTLNVTDDPSSSASTGRDRASTSITIENFRYSPNPIQVRSGARVTVTNKDGTVHTLTARDGSFDTGELGGGAHATVTIAHAGKHEYFCEIHNYMTGTIEIR